MQTSKSTSYWGSVRVVVPQDKDFKHEQFLKYEGLPATPAQGCINRL